MIRGIERWAGPAAKRFEKRRRHRQFRHWCKQAIWLDLQDLEGSRVSHMIRARSEYLL
jgi:hypothetical protein